MTVAQWLASYFTVQRLQGWTALSLACARGHAELGKLFANVGNAKLCNSNEENIPLHADFR